MTLNRPSPSTKKDWLVALLAEHEAAMTRYATRLVKDQHRAHDLVQEAFLKLWKTDVNDAPDNPAAWLYAVLRNLCFDHLRKERRMVSYAPEELPEASTFGGEGDAAADGMSAVLAMLGTLSPDQQEVIRLKFQSGLSYKDISRITGHSVSNVGVLIHTGVKALRAAMTAPAAPSTKGGAK